jgi:hypothetical protein
MIAKIARRHLMSTLESVFSLFSRNSTGIRGVVLRAIWRSLCGDIWRRCLSRSSIATFCGFRLALPIPT